MCQRELLSQPPNSASVSVKMGITGSTYILVLVLITYSGQHLGFCSRGGKIAVFAYQGGQALHAVQYNIYSKISRGGKHPARGGANAPPPPK